MTTSWQITELSTRDAAGNYIDDLAAGIEYVIGFALDIFSAGSDPEDVSISAVTATLARYRQTHERTAPTISRRDEAVELDALLDGDNVAITIPADVLLPDQVYQLVITATDSTGATWARTREYRVVA